MLKVAATWALYILLTGCGVEESLKPAADALPPVVFAGQELIDKSQVVPGSYIVAFKSNLTPQKFFQKNYKSEYQEHFFQFAHMEWFEKGVKELHYITGMDLNFSGSTKPGDEAEASSSTLPTPPAMDLRWYERSERQAQLASIVKVDFESEKEAQELLTKWYDQGLLYYAEPNYSSRHLQDGTISNWSDYSELYEQTSSGGNAPWMDQIGLVKAMEYMDQQGVSFENQPLIAVLDSGLDYEHANLINNVWNNPQPGAIGCDGDLHGCNTTKSFKGKLGSGDVWPVGLSGPGASCSQAGSDLAGVCSHGTHVAGIIAAEPNQSEGYGGMCPICKIVPVKIVGSNYLGEGRASNITDSAIISGLTYVTRFELRNDNAIRVVNASFGKFQRSRTVEHLVRLLKKKGSGITVVAAAGNEDSMKRQYPAAFQDVIGVVNIDSDTSNPAKAVSSNFGIWTKIAAPGSGICDGLPDQGIKSTVPGDLSQCETGTSMASPVVAGIVGLMLVAEPGLSSDDIVARLTSTAEPILYEIPDNAVYKPQIQGEPNPVALLGAGVVNAYNAIANERPAKPLTSVGLPTKAEDRINDCGVLTQGQVPSSFPPLALVLILPVLLPWTESIRLFLMKAIGYRSSQHER